MQSRFVSLVFLIVLLVAPLTVLQFGVLPVVYAAETVFYSGAGDGYSSYGGGGAITWAVAHHATAGQAADYTGTTILVQSMESTEGTGWNAISRTFLPFNTSDLPDTAIVSAATLCIYVTSKSDTDNDGYDYLNVINTTQASTAAVVVEDYDQCGAVQSPTTGATALDLTAMATSAYVNFTLDATGINWINLTGWTVLGIREGHDIADHQIAANTDNNAIFRSSDYTGTSYDPILSVEYTLASDTTKPTYSNVGTNTTFAGITCLFYTQWTDNIGLATTGGFIFGTNNTGTPTNETWTAFTANPDWSNKTKTLNSTLNVRVEWWVYANDTSNNWNNTGTQYLITTTPWLTGWSYRKSHMINNATGAGTNYQIQLLVVNGSSFDSGNTVYTNNHTESYFGDLRFTDDDAITVLDFWFETLNAGKNVTVWIEVADDLSSVNRTIYIYYGKVDEISTGSGTDTFLYFNAFSSAVGFTRFPYDNITTVGTEDGVNATGWSIGTSALQHYQYLNTSHEYALATLANDNVAIGAKVNLLTLSAFESAGVTGRYTVESNVIACYFLRIEYYGANPQWLRLVRDKAGVETVYDYYSFNVTGSTAYAIELRMCGAYLAASLDGVQRLLTYDYTSIASGTELGCYADMNASKDQSFDDFYVRKYVYPEPTHGAWGIEENVESGQIPTNFITSLTNTVNKVDWTESIATVYLGTMFGETSMTDLKNAIAASTSWQDVLTWSAITIKFGIENETKIKWALDNATMSEGLPYVESGGYNGFLVQDRGGLYGYYWANKYSYLQSKWNLTTAFNNFASAYNWTGHGFLCYVNATNTASISYGPRYLDECAQTLACFLVFNEVCNVSEAITYAETEWKYLNNNFWCTNSAFGAPHFAYALTNDTFGQGWECSGGAFLQIIGWLKYLSPSVGNISRLITDMSNRFLIDRWLSPQWNVIDNWWEEEWSFSSYPAIVIHHAFTNPQRRLTSTVTAWSSLFAAYTLFNDTETQYFQDELNGYDQYLPAWKCLFNSTAALYDINADMFCTLSGENPTNYATALATALLFFMGMTPVNATLAVPVESLFYEHLYNMFDSQIFNISLTNHKVVVGIEKAGAITFNFNASLTQMFTNVGLYELTFDGNWNAITNCTEIGSLPERRYLEILTRFVAGWNSNTAFTVDLGKTLEQICANIQYGGIGSTIIIKINGTEYRYDYGYEPNTTVLILATSDELQIYCTTGGDWYHDYSNFYYRKDSSSQTFTVTLNGQRLIEGIRSASQTIALALNMGRLVEWLKTVTQTISFTLQNARLSEFVRTVSQTLALAFVSVGEKLGNYIANVALTITTTFQNSRLAEWTRQATQTLSLSLTTSRIAELLAIALLTITTAFNANRLVDLVRQAAQSLNFLLNGERLIEVSRAVSQNITLTLQTVGEMVGNYFRNALLDVSLTFATLPEVPEATILLGLAIALIVVACVVTYAIAKTQKEPEKD